MPNTSYLIVYKKTVEKDLRGLSLELRKVIVKKILALSVDPFPKTVTKLSGSKDLCRLRHSDYRIVCQIQNSKLVVLIIKVGHRREIDKDF